jgi:hypothetical protein
MLAQLEWNVNAIFIFFKYATFFLLSVANLIK